MGKSAFLAISVGALLFAAGQARAETITFDNTAAAGTFVIPALPYTEGAFTVANGTTGSSNGMFDQAYSGAISNSSDYFGWIGGEYFVVSRTDTAAFGLTSLDLGQLEDSPSLSFTITGYLSGGGTVTFSGSTTAWQTYTFGSGWSSLSKFEVKSDTLDGAIDSIVLNVVPLPPSVLMGLSLLGGLVLVKVLRNRRRAAFA